MATLKQSTTYNRSFLMVQSADHITGLTGAAPSVTLSKAGAAFGSAITATVHELASGWYYIALTTGDTGTLGDLAFHCTAASGDPTDFVDQVVDAAGGIVSANIIQVNSVPITGIGTPNNPWGPV